MPLDYRGGTRSGCYGLGASNRSERDREEDDFYATPYIATRRLLDKLKEMKISLPHHISEPAVGMGHIAKILEDNGYEVSAADIVDRKWPNTKIENFLESKSIDGDAIVTNPPYKCFSFDTEIKTNNGWKKYKDIDTSKDKVLSINPDTLEVEWSGILKVIERDEANRMVSFKHRFMDILVTEDHRMFSYRNGKHYAVKDNAIPANEITSSDYIPKTGYSWHGKYIPNIEIPECYISNGQKEVLCNKISIKAESFARFLGLWLADGYCRHTKNNKGNYRYTFGIKQNCSRENEVLNILSCLPFEVHKYMDGKDKANYEIHSKQVWEYLIKFGTSKTKYVPDEIKNNSTSVLKAFMDGYTFGDSTINKQSYCTIYSSVSEQLIGDIQEIQLKLGYFEQTHFVNNKAYKNPIYKIYYKMNNKLTQNRLYYKSARKKDISYVPYNNKVFCLQLEKNHFFMLRRNGHQFISGNCAADFVVHAMEKLKEGQMCIMLLKIQFLEGGNRARRLYKNGLRPKYALIFPERINCAKAGNFKEENGLFEEATKDLSWEEKDKLGPAESSKGGQIAYMWAIWEKGYEGLTQTDWL